ncbi:MULTISPECIES: hypothetical protein [Rhizobium]|uniref:hypothetical protein n=1 Tax=Rhizobium TaxID=379 RepID=UPI0007F078F0|nr:MULTISPECIES: hypothetical protein [Rhizobium]ANL04656.1 hypothetical protein AMJ99_CH03134 [Rhizobium esperanzae]ANM35501.1 hypothetical protein AMK04_CH03138 [Rhizobium sp. N871]
MDRDWREGLRERLEDFVDSLVVQGAKQADVYDAVEGVGHLRIYMREVFSEAPQCA